MSILSLELYQGFATTPVEPIVSPGEPWPASCSARRLGGTSLQLNTPFKHPEQEDLNEIDVTDPTHPLCGRRFPLQPISSRPRVSAEHVFVSYDEFIVLRISIAVTNLAPPRPSSASKEQRERAKPIVSPPELRQAFVAVGQKLPQLWQQDGLTREQRKALLRCLIDKVVIHRAVPDRVQTRIVWRGGDTTALDIPVPVGSFADLSQAAEMEAIILDLSRKGKTDAEIADHLTALGHRSPLCTDAVLPSTVMNIRLKHGTFLERGQSHPRQVPGYLTLPQVAHLLDVKPHWLYHQINKGRIQVTKDNQTGLYLFPDNAETLTAFQQFKEGKIENLRFSREHQDV